MYKFIDMHCDTISAIRESDKRECLRENSFHVDLEKMKKAGYMLQTFAAYVYMGNDKNPLEECLGLIDTFHEQIALNKDYIQPVYQYSDIIENQRAGKMSALLSIEEGGCCKGKLENLRNFYRLGVRMMTLSWNFENEIAYPNLVREGRYGKPDTKNGLKDLGIQFIEEMERLGMIIDVSHLSDAGFYDVYEHTKKPFLASHSNARNVCSHVRNLTDDMIRKIAERGGVTGINLYADFVDQQSDSNRCQSNMENLIAHIKHIKNVGGISSIGLGTDFDGISSKGLEIKDCSHMPLLADGMKKAGFHESEIDAVLYQNVLNLFHTLL